MDEKLVKLTPHWFLRMFGAECAELHLSDSGVKISIEGGDFKPVRLLSLVQPGVIYKGLVFNALRFEAASEVIKVSWLSETVVKTCHEKLFNYAYSRIMGEVNEAIGAIEGELKPDHYIRIVKYTGVLMKAREAIRRIGNIDDLSLFKGRDKLLYKELLKVSKWSASDIKPLQDSYIESMVGENKKYFDEVEKNPLTDKQRIACIVDEENNIVLAGAGTGKTSVMIGRVGFFIRSGQAKTDDILMLAFASKAKDEMKERMAARIPGAGVTVRTFHSLGLKIIAEAEGSKPAISKYSSDDVLLNKKASEWFAELLKTDSYKAGLVDYFKHYLCPAINPFEFNTKGEYIEFLRDNDLRTLKGEAVKSYQESVIANYLFSMGIRYEYEAKYQYQERTTEFKPYQPDFYLPDYDIYIEHFGIDRKGATAPFVDRKSYNEGIAWKRATHERHKTKLVETYHYEHIEGGLLEGLNGKLVNHGVVLNPVSDDEMLLTLRELGSVDEMAKLLCQLIRRVKGNGYSSDSIDGYIDQQEEFGQTRAALQLLKPVLLEYEEELAVSGEVDFDDMIIKAAEYVRTGVFVSDWKHILVDEFQDISASRAKLVKELHMQIEGSTLFCVGDDWQAIYRFSGSDISYTTKYQQKFGPTRLTTLDRTFRFNSSICEIASRFVLENGNQVKKELTPNKIVSEPHVSLYRATKSKLEHGETLDPRLLTVLDKVGASVESTAKVFLLSRFHFHLPSGGDLKRIKERYSNLEIKVRTIHASKGEEADFVIILGLEKGEFGLPSHKVTNPLLDALLPSSDGFKFAEERRLLYVALTRAKRKVYLVCDMSQPSEFINEFIEGSYPIDTREFDTSFYQEICESLKCIRCDVGSMTLRKSSFGVFCGCSNYPYCNHTERACVKCNSIMKHSGRYKVCTSENCNQWVPKCTVCDAEMKSREGKFGEFWGCRNYRSIGMSCGHTENSISPPSREAVS